MAWITKNSGNAVIDRREEPYVSEAMKADFTENILTRYPTKQAATMPILHAVQHEYNWLPMQAIEEIADFLELHASEVLDTASFYEEYWLKPKGKYQLNICRSISCELMGFESLLELVKKKLGVEEGETTPDGKFTLMPVECLGSCGTAPCSLVNEKLHEDLTVENFERILDELE